MGRIGLRLAAAALLLGSVGCTTVPKEHAGRMSLEDFGKIAVDKTTANQVRELLGPPSRILSSRAVPGEEWGYRYAGNFARRMFWIGISPEGVVRATSDSIDYEADSRYRGG